MCSRYSQTKEKVVFNIRGIQISFAYGPRYNIARTQKVPVMRYKIYAKGGRWNIASEIAEALVTILPDDAESWLNLACATRRKKGGGNHDANQILYEGHVKFPDDYPRALIPCVSASARGAVAPPTNQTILWQYL